MALTIAAVITGIFLTLAFQKFTGVFDRSRSSRGSGGGGDTGRGSDPEVG